MEDCWSFTCCLFWTFGSLLKCNQLKFCIQFHFGRCLTKLAQLVPLPYSQGKSTHYSHSCMTYDLNLALRGIFNYRFFPNRFSVCLNLFVFLFLVTLCLAMFVQSCMEWIQFVFKQKINMKITHTFSILTSHIYLFIIGVRCWGLRGCEMQQPK